MNTLTPYAEGMPRPVSSTMIVDFTLASDPVANGRVFRAVMEMDCLDIATLERAYTGASVGRKPGGVSGE